MGFGCHSSVKTEPGGKSDLGGMVCGVNTWPTGRTSGALAGRGSLCGHAARFGGCRSGTIPGNPLIVVIPIPSKCIADDVEDGILLQHTAHQMGPWPVRIQRHILTAVGFFGFYGTVYFDSR